jgi:hypothetical protein
VRRRLPVSIALITVIAATALFVLAGSAPASGSAKYDITTLKGKVASLYGTAGLQVRFSALIEEEAEEGDAAPVPGAPITPDFVLSSPLDGDTVLPPDVTVNQDTAAAPQNETAIAVDPNNPNRIVGGANDYVSRTWACTVSGTPCSALGEAASGTYFSNDGGGTWCCTSTDPAHLGTIIPGINRLTGGQYDAAGDPSVAFDSKGHVYFAGLGFDRTSPPNTVEVSKGTFSGGSLSWGAPTFINPTTSPSTLNDKEWIAVDSHAGSPFQDRIYVTWTRFLFSAGTGNYVQSPIAFVSSSDGGATFTTPKLISGNVLYGQGSRPVVGPDGTLYVFWRGSTRLASLNSTYVVKSSDGGATWSMPVAISGQPNSGLLKDTAFRNNSYPAAAAAPNGDLYASWTTQTSDGSVAVYSKSTNGGDTWTAPTRVFAATTRVPIGYPATQPDGSILSAPDPEGAVEDIFPAVGIGPNGQVYMGAYRGDVVSPWQTCAAGPPPPEGRINCTTLGNYIHNTRLDFVVRDLTTGVTGAVSTHPINTRNGFGGGFFGDYNDLAVGSDNVFHAFWTDSNNKQAVVWFYGFEFVPTVINQEDVVTAAGNF